MALSSWKFRARDSGPTEWRESAHARQRIARTYPRSIVQPAPQGFGQPRSGTRRAALTAWRYGEHLEAVGEKRANRTSNPIAKWTGKCYGNPIIGLTSLERECFSSRKRFAGPFVLRH